MTIQSPLTHPWRDGVDPHGDDGDEPVIGSEQREGRRVLELPPPLNLVPRRSGTAGNMKPNDIAHSHPHKHFHLS